MEIPLAVWESAFTADLGTSRMIGSTRILASLLGSVVPVAALI
jgi:hypothetical protein